MLLQATNRLVEAEPLMRRALSIDEASYGTEHPRVAIHLNNLAMLLQATNRLVEAEPLMLRHLEIFLNFTRATGHSHPHLQAGVLNYAGLLRAMGRSGQEVHAALAELGRLHGVDISGAGGREGFEPSASLLAVLDEIMRNPAKIEEILARLQQQAPDLLPELLSFIQSQQHSGPPETV